MKSSLFAGLFGIFCLTSAQAGVSVQWTNTLEWGNAFYGEHPRLQTPDGESLLVLALGKGKPGYQFDGSKFYEVCAELLGEPIDRIESADVDYVPETEISTPVGDVAVLDMGSLSVRRSARSEYSKRQLIRSVSCLRKSAAGALYHDRIADMGDRVTIYSPMLPAGPGGEPILIGGVVVTDHVLQAICIAYGYGKVLPTSRVDLRSEEGLQVAYPDLLGVYGRASRTGFLIRHAFRTREVLDHPIPVAGMVDCLKKPPVPPLNTPTSRASLPR